MGENNITVSKTNVWTGLSNGQIHSQYYSVVSEFISDTTLSSNNAIIGHLDSQSISLSEILSQIQLYINLWADTVNNEEILIEKIKILNGLP